MQSSIHHDDQIPQGTVPPSPNSDDFAQRYTALMVFGLIGIATTGYFLGLTSPMTASSVQPLAKVDAVRIGEHSPESAAAIPATDYSDMHLVQINSRQQLPTQLTKLQQPPYDINAKIEVNYTEKLASLADRKTRRAYDGAPPTVPHSIDQLDSVSCMACHGEGLRSDTLRASKIPHPFYANCTQCHVEQHAKFAVASATHENTFAGVAAPTNGGRTSQGDSPKVPHTTWMLESLQNMNPAADWVPPVVPHTTWMRNDCLSCHGRTAAPGMGSTHLWRSDCFRCHGESPLMNQSMSNDALNFLPSPAILDNHE